MSDYLTPDALLAATILPEDDVVVAGGKVRVRGLTRGETFLLNKRKSDGGIRTEEEWERAMVALAMVEPKLTEDQVGAWQRQDLAGGGLEQVTRRISELSGLSQGADKSGVPGDGADAGAGVRALPGGEAGDDDRPASNGDEL